jgi:putative serine protease PepD
MGYTWGHTPPLRSRSDINDDRTPRDPEHEPGDGPEETPDHPAEAADIRAESVDSDAVSPTSSDEPAARPEIPPEGSGDEIVATSSTRIVRDEEESSAGVLPPFDIDEALRTDGGPGPERDSRAEAGPGADEAAAAEVPESERAMRRVASELSALQARLAELEGRRRPGWAAVIAAIVVGLLAAFVIGRMTAADDDPVQAAPISAAATSTTAAPSTTPAPTETTTSEVPPETTTTPAPTTSAPPPDGAGSNLISQIAALVGPGVVQIETNSALGSGVIYDDDGYILTAAHVVEGPDDIVTVRLADGRAFDGEIVGTHALSDIAVIKIDGVEGLRAIELAPIDSLEIGELAVAIGSPFGFEQSVTSGIVSAVDRIVDGVIMVQTDAAINPGNSGGPLVDELGRVIGINDQIFTTSQGNEGVGFAVSIELAILIAEQLVAGEDIQLAFLGVLVSPADGDPAGALVENVTAGSAAEAAGLLEGDLIVEADGRLIINSDALRARVIKKRPGDAFELVILRDGEILTLVAVLGATDA